MKRLSLLSLILFFVIFFLCSGVPLLAQSSKKVKRFDPDLYKAMSWRSIGPYRGGRVTAVAGINDQKFTYYFGATGGGVWKSEDGGISWQNVSDGFFKTGSVGAIAVSDDDPNVVYVGMGEAPIRGNVSHGDGIYKSTDAGKTWTHLGLSETHQISRIRIHPKNPDLVYAAALGHVYGPNEKRGVFRSKDGGITWEKILFRDNKTGAIDLILDPLNSRIIYASLWEAGRTAYSLTSGGPGSGLFKSIDGGDTWTELTGNRGLPTGVIGKIGVTASPARAGRIWAIVESLNGGVFRSDDGGDSWLKVNDDRQLRQRAWYYSRIYADTQSPDTVYVLNTGLYRSVDGGSSYSALRPPHGDNHDLWIDPQNPDRMINSNDGGANVSNNGGLSWTGQDNQPTAQFYHVVTDNQFPYWVYGAQQDNSTVRIASRTSGGGITQKDWYPVGGGESGHIAPRHDNPDIVYAGSYGGLITRWDYATRQQRIISAWPDNPMGWGAGDIKYRFGWTAPIVVSRFDSNVLYHCAQVIFKTTNEGQSWEIISPDLTTNDKSRQQKSGGPITKDDTSVEYYCTIFALTESFQDPQILWAGSDDGLVHITKDGGHNWENITPKQMPNWSLISMIEVSTFDAETAYLAVDRHELDDFGPLIYKTDNSGKSWIQITNGLPANSFVRVVRQDPKRKGLLYAGTETGLFVSFDDGANWQSLQLNLPVVPVHDMVVKEDDLVVATHGRSFWILDNLTPLHQITEDVAKMEVFLFKPRDAYRMGGGGRAGQNVGQNPPSGSVVYFYLKEKPEGPVSLELLDENDRGIQTFASRNAMAQSSGQMSGRAGGFGSRSLTAEAGMNRFVFDMRYPGAERVPGAILWGGNLNGPTAVPGHYKVKLTVDGKTSVQAWEWKKDPRLETTQEDFQKQFDFLIKIRDKISEVNSSIILLREVRSQIENLSKKVQNLKEGRGIVESVISLKKKLKEIEDVLIQSKSKSGQDPLNFPILLDNKIAALAGIVARADACPTDQSFLLFEKLSEEADVQIEKLENILKNDLSDLNKKVKDAGIPAVMIERKK
ncbi:glycosyl hydrolase [Acidobacteriota bacterium]